MAQTKQNMPDEAMQNYLKAIQLNPNFFEAHFELGEPAGEAG